MFYWLIIMMLGCRSLTDSSDSQQSHTMQVWSARRGYLGLSRVGGEGPVRCRRPFLRVSLDEKSFEND